MSRQYTITLDLNELEYVHNALALYMEEQSTLARGDNTAEVWRGNDEDGLDSFVATGEVIDISDMFVAQYVDTKNLRKRFVDLVGRDLTEEGQ